MTGNRPVTQAPPRERGLVLVVSLILLLLLTLLGLASSRSTVLQSKMAGYAQARGAAFQGAEAALAAAQVQLIAGTVCSQFSGSGCYPAQDPSATPRWQTIDWSSSAGATFAYSGVSTALARFFVEELPPEPAPGQNLSRGNYGNVPPLQYFQITAEAATDGTPGQVMLQGGFRP